MMRKCAFICKKPNIDNFKKVRDLEYIFIFTKFLIKLSIYKYKRIYRFILIFNIKK